MTTGELLKELENGTHSQRMARMVEIGRQSLQNEPLRALLAELEEGNGYRRRLALQACYGSRNSAPVLRLLNDSSRLVRGLALHLAPLVCSDEQLLDLLRSAQARLRRVLLRDLSKRRRALVIDRYLEGLAAQNDKDLPPLLAFASEKVAETLWPLAAKRAEAHDWYRVAQRHPQVVLRFLLEEIEPLSDVPPSAISRCNSALQSLADVSPQSALQLLRVLWQRGAANKIWWSPVALRMPRETAALVLTLDEKMARADGVFQSRVQRLEPEQITALLENHPALLGEPANWLPRLDATRRLAAYSVAARGWQNKNGVMDADIVALLPREQREAEARRHWNLAFLSTRPTERLPYAAFLPWDEARQVVAPFLHNPDADLRSAAHRALSGAVRYHRAHLPELLELIQQRGNEQDPVRGIIISGLASLPPCIWQSEHLEGLGIILQQALDAADLSPNTARQVEEVVIKILPRHAKWAAEFMAVLVRSRGYLTSYNLETRIDDNDMRRLAPVLAPLFQAWQARERESQFIYAVRALGRRARVFPGLESMLEETAREGGQNAAHNALELLNEHFRAHFQILVPQLLEKDKSYATLPVVYSFLHHQRQDLITDFLGRVAYKGKFSTGRTRFVLPLLDGFYRWVPEQQELFGDTLKEILSDAERDNIAKIRAVQQMAALPDVTPRALWQAARRQSQGNIAIRDSALRALARLDAGQGVDELIAALDDDRARIAIYALRSTLMEMPLGRALEILRAAPTQKVTVAKEIVRLLGDLKAPEALQDLLAWGERDLHRDVHIALLRALWEHLDEDRVWPILEAASRSDDAAVATMAARTTAPRLSVSVQKKLADLLAQLTGHPDAKVRLNVLQRCVSDPVRDPEKVMRKALFGALDSLLPDEYQAAARAVFHLYPRETELIADAIARLMPRRRAFDEVMRLFVGEIDSYSRLREAGRAVLDRLAADPLCASWRVRLAIRVLKAEALLRLLEELIAADLLHAETLGALCHEIAPAPPIVSGHWESYFSDMFSRLTNLKAPEKLEDVLSNHSDERLRRIALAALVAASRDKRGWTLERRSRLAKFQNDASPLVASVAQFTFAPEEEPNVE
jgi:hypothetical protein